MNAGVQKTGVGKEGIEIKIRKRVGGVDTFLPGGTSPPSIDLISEKAENCLTH